MSLPPAYSVKLVDQAGLPSGVTDLAGPPVGKRWVILYVAFQIPAGSPLIEYAIAGNTTGAPFAGGYTGTGVSENSYGFFSTYAVIDNPEVIRVYCAASGYNVTASGWELTVA